MTRIAIGGKFRLFDDAFFGGHDQIAFDLKTPDWYHGGNFLVRLELQEVYCGFATRHTTGLGNAIDLEPVHFANIGKKQEKVVGRSDKELFDKVLLAGLHGHLALAAPTLALVEGERLALQVASVTLGDDHAFFGDEVFNIDVVL